MRRAIRTSGFGGCSLEGAVRTDLGVAALAPLLSLRKDWTHGSVEPVEVVGSREEGDDTYLRGDSCYALDRPASRDIVTAYFR